MTSRIWNVGMATVLACLALAALTLVQSAPVSAASANAAEFQDDDDFPDMPELPDFPDADDMPQPPKPPKAPKPPKVPEMPKPPKVPKPPQGAGADDDDNSAARDADDAPSSPRRDQRKPAAKGGDKGASKGDSKPKSRDTGGAIAKDGVAMRVATDADFMWDGFIEEIYYPDLSAASGELVKAGAIGDKITAMNLEREIKARFQKHGNWPAEEPDDAKLMAMIYYSVDEERPTPPAICPVQVETTTSTKVSLKANFGASLVSGDGWTSLFAEVGMEVEVSETTTTTQSGTQRPAYDVKKGKADGYHSTLVLEVYYLDGEGKQKKLGKAAMVGMAYFFSERRPTDDKLKQVAGDLVDKLQKDAMTPGGNGDEKNVDISDVTMRVASDPDYVFDGMIEEIWYPDYSDAGAALAANGAVGDKITGMNLERAIKEKFQEKGNWPAENVADAGLMAMVYYTVVEDCPAPPAICPVEVTDVVEQKVSLKVKADFKASLITGDSWAGLFAEAGLEVEIKESVKVGTEGATRPAFELKQEADGYHCTLAIEVYYFTGEGKKKKPGKSAMCGMAYFKSDKRPTDAKLKAVAKALVEKLDKDAMNRD